ncbi:site-2 protease family protein [Clostridium sp.]|uniref:site-2 protease family protein n=1 Tax=Clostridium sp. TaxID=1506 RepID=UPI0025BB24AD|nr:site-2 protease family protein [Clostridium sp.]MBS4956459.1 peptidase M50 [Clostridium sp.]MDU4882752.1 site-2 protease family protein [Clostridium celatum]MDU7075978.1 site-2 protease family protein [Clostridium celatum]
MDRWKKSVLAEIILFFILLSLNKSIILAFISIFLHEISHIVVAKKNGCKFNNFKIHIYGTNAEFINIDELSKKEKAQIYLAGPCMNLAIAFIFFLVGLIINNSIIDKIININLSLLFFNILPAYPLDGSRILEIILSEKILYKKVNDIISKISYIIAIFLITITLIAFIYSKSLNVSLIVAAIIICLITKGEKKSAMYILMRNIFVKRNKLLRNKYIENKSISVYYKLGLINVMAIIDKNRFNSFYILDDDLKLLFIMHEDELIEALKLYGNITLEEYFNIRSISSN